MNNSGGGYVKKSYSKKSVKSKRIRKQSFDFTIFILVILLVAFGIVMVFSSSYYYALTNSDFNNNMYHFVSKQIKYAAVSVVAMLFVANSFNYHFYKRFAKMAYYISLVLLLAVIVVGSSANGSQRWLQIGSFGFQPSEIAKIAVILYLSLYVSQKKDIKTFKGFISCCIVLFIPVVLIAVSNFSTALVVAVIGCAIIFIGGGRIGHFALFGVPASGLGAVFIILFPYRFSRIKIWLDPFSDPIDKGYQIIQSLYAVASGGLFGLGLGQSRQKTFIPEAYNDIIFAIICEELGLFGALIVIFLFIALIYRGIRVAMNSQDMFGCLVATGIISMIAVQAIINISVVTNTIPNTGIPLPFISYGGTSLVITMAAMGLLLNISKYQKGVD